MSYEEESAAVAPPVTGRARTRVEGITMMRY